MKITTTVEFDETNVETAAFAFSALGLIQGLSEKEAAKHGVLAAVEIERRTAFYGRASSSICTEPSNFVYPDDEASINGPVAT